MRSDDNPSSNSMKRLPLTPIPVEGPFPSDDTKSTMSTTFVFVSRPHSDHSDDEVRPSLYQRRKSSVPTLTLGKVSYNRRRSHHRRSSPSRNSPTISASFTPIHTPPNKQRRTSLPALHFLESVQNDMPLHITSNPSSRRGSISEDIYSGLQNYSFGTPPRRTHNDAEDSDEDERLRRDRAKMRAIDDGTRRPSLPPNDPAVSPPASRLSFSSLTSSVAPSMSSSAHIVVGERQLDEHDEPDWDFVMGDITPTTTSPPLTTPSTVDTIDRAGSRNGPRRPSLPIPVPSLRRRSRSAEELATEFDRMRNMTPTQLSTSSPLFAWAQGHSPDETRGRSSSPEENALEGFDLDFILSQPLSAAEADRRLRRQASPGRLRSKFRTKTIKNPPRVEDTFTGHLDQYDPLYERRKLEWSFRRVIRPSGGVQSRGGSVGSLDRERWRCESIGEFIVSKSADYRQPLPMDIPQPFYNRLLLRHQPSDYSRGSRDYGHEITVHRHKKAHAYSIVRSFYTHSEKTKDTGENILLGTKTVLREYTRTESTRSLNTHGLIDDSDSRSTHRHHHRESRSNAASFGTIHHHSHSETTQSNGRPSGAIMHNLDSNISVAERSSLPRSSQPSSSHSHAESRSRKDSTRTITTTSSRRSASSSRPSSLRNSNTAVAIESSTPVTHWDVTAGTSPRTSTSHAEAFAMRGSDTRGVDSHQHRRETTPPHVDAPPLRAAPLPPPATPSPPPQQKAFGFSVLSKPFRSKPQRRTKEGKEPPSPGAGDEDEPKTTTQDGKYAPPWITVVRRGEKEQQDHMIRILNTSFESVGLIPPQDSKKKSSKSRPKTKECAVFLDVPEDSMCMLLPLWPGEATPGRSQPHSHSESLSRHRSDRRGDSINAQQPRSRTIPLQERKFLLVYYTPFVQSPTDDGFNLSNNNKKRRRPQTAGDRPSHVHAQTTIGGPSSFRVTARLLSYDDVRSSGVRLPDRGLLVPGSLRAANLAIPLPSVPCFSSQVIAQCHGLENGVELVQEGLEQLGLMDHTAPRGVDVNGDPTGVKLSVLGKAVVEMVWSGCMSLMVFS